MAAIKPQGTGLLNAPQYQVPGTVQAPKPIQPVYGGQASAMNPAGPKPANPGMRPMNPAPQPIMAAKPQGMQNPGQPKSTFAPPKKQNLNNNVHFTPISAINMYNMDWVIKARVTKKTQTRQFNSNGKEGKVFSVNLIDAAGTEIGAAFFNDACDQFASKIHEGGVYTFQGGRVQPARASKFNTIKNDNQISFDRDAKIEEVNDDPSIGVAKYSPCRSHSTHLALISCPLTPSIISQWKQP
jgi:hypothetical protein